MSLPTKNKSGHKGAAPAHGQGTRKVGGADARKFASFDKVEHKGGCDALMQTDGDCKGKK